MTDAASSAPLPRLINNSDGDSTTFLAVPPPMTVDEFCRDIEELAGTAVDVFTNAMGRGDDTFCHRTEFGDLYGEGFTDWPEAENLQYVRWIAEHTQHMLAAGMDPNEVLAERAHARGMQFWPALRMNDIHEDDSSRWDAFRSNFKRNNRHLLIGSPYPTRHGGGYPADDYTWAFDFSHAEVRERKIGLILETCERYDVDGFELDFQRGPWYFKDGHEAEGAPLITDMLRQVRDGIARIAQQKGRPITLMLRVPPTVEKCLKVGLDVPTWIKEELADLIVLMDKGYLDMSADVRDFVEMARGRRCRIGAGLEHIAKGYGFAEADMLYAAALSYWHQGASTLYLFNYDCHRQNWVGGSYTPNEIQVLSEIHDPAIIARRNKRYCVPLDMENHTPSEGGLFPLPVELTRAGDLERFTICVGDDIEAAQRDGALKEAWLRVTIAGREVDASSITVWVNGQAIPGAAPLRAPLCATIACHDAPVVQGDNEITIELTDSPAAPVRIEGIELIIVYHGS